MHPKDEAFVPCNLRETDRHQSMDENHADILDSYHKQHLKKERCFHDEEEGRASSVGNHQDGSSGFANEDDDVDSHFDTAPGTPDTVAAADFESRVASSSRSHATKKTGGSSVDRRVSEAVQFFQAVGETPPASQDELRHFIEDDDENDDAYSDDERDADSTEVRVERDASGVLLPKTKQHDVAVPSPQDAAEKDDTKAQPFFLFSLPGGARCFDFVYKGITANPPEITKRGISRGNFSQLHRKAWLEVSDKKHRYGKNLRLYYRHWESLGCPTNSFFDWLDSKGEAAGGPLPELEECPRSELDNDTVLYITDEEITKQYALSFERDSQGRGIVLDRNGGRVRTGTDGWIFVLRDDVMYGAQKVTVTALEECGKERFHHSSFFGGKAVAAAGIFVTDDDGVLKLLYPHSGHYRPGEAEMQRILFFLFREGIDLRTFDVDIQQLIYVNRHDAKKEKRKKKDSLYLKQATSIAHFLAHKARFIDAGIFEQIDGMKDLLGCSVRQALSVVDAQQDENFP